MKDIDEMLLVSLQDVHPNTIIKLCVNLKRNGLLSTIGGLQSFGLANLFDDTKIQKGIGSKELDSVLTALEKNNVFLTIKEEEFNELDFQELSWNVHFKEHIRDVLEKHDAIESTKENTFKEKTLN